MHNRNVKNLNRTNQIYFFYEIINILLNVKRFINYILFYDQASRCWKLEKNFLKNQIPCPLPPPLGI